MDWHSPSAVLPAHIRFIRETDWTATALGPAEEWPPQLHQMIDFMLVDPSPAAVMWGESLTMIYNESFVQFAGNKHPKLMGSSPIIEYSEVWEDMFAPIIDRGRRSGLATRHENVPLFLRRHKYLEEVFVTYNFVPIGKSGFYHTAMETTREVLSQRRAETSLIIGEAASARSQKDYWDEILKGFESNENDVGYVVAYTFKNLDREYSSISTASDSVGSRASSGERVPRSCTLAGVVGKNVIDVPLSFDVAAIDEEEFTKSVKKSIRSGELVRLHHESGVTPDWLSGRIPSRAFNDLVTEAVIMPIRPTSRNDEEGKNAIGFLVIGLNPRRIYDEDYARAVKLWMKGAAGAAASVVLLEKELRKQVKLTRQLDVSARNVLDSESKFDRFAEMSTVAMWIVDPEGHMLYANQAWRDQMPAMSGDGGLISWSPCISEEFHPVLKEQWDLLRSGKIVSFECRLTSLWKPPSDTNGATTERSRWVLCSATPELNANGTVKSIWGVNTEVSNQKWAEEIKELRLADVLENKRQTENFLDMTSHEMRNPLSAILQCSEGIATTLEKARASVSDDLIDFETMIDSAQTIALCAQHQKRIVDDILTLSKLDASLLVVTPAEVDPITTVKHALKMSQQEMQSARIEIELCVQSSYHDLKIDRVFLDPSRLLQVLINILTNAIKFTQFQVERKITVNLSAALDSPGEDHESGADYFAPRSKMSPGLGADWGDGQDVFIRVEINDTGCGLSPEEMDRLFLRFSQASPKTHVQYGGSGLGLFISKALTELQGGRIGVSSAQGRGSSFKFYVKARRAPRKDLRHERAANENAAQLQRLRLESHTGSTNAHEAIRAMSSPNYVNPLNRKHSDRSNPIVGTPSDPNALHVLVVEDNLINQKVMARQLRQSNCVVHVANHGADALLFLKKTTFAKDMDPHKAIPLSLILLDLEMPVMNGIECIRTIRRWQQTGDLTRPVPVLAVTANARLEQIQEAKDAGMDGVVTKPFKVSELLPQMFSVVEKSSN